jgi:hypothetical protein
VRIEKKENQLFRKKDVQFIFTPFIKIILYYSKGMVANNKKGVRHDPEPLDIHGRRYWD